MLKNLSNVGLLLCCVMFPVLLEKNVKRVRVSQKDLTDFDFRGADKMKIEGDDGLNLGNLGVNFERTFDEPGVDLKNEFSLFLKEQRRNLFGPGGNLEAFWTQKGNFL